MRQLLRHRPGELRIVPPYVPRPLSKEELEQRQRDREASRRVRTILWLVALGIAVVAALIAYWNMTAAEAARRAQEAARVAELARQSQELVRFFPERLRGYRRSGAVFPNPGAAPAATAQYVYVADPRILVSVRVTRWEYPNMTKIFSERTGSFGLVNGHHARETYRGRPAVLFTAGNNARNYFASYAVLLADSIEVTASTGGSREGSKRHARAVVQAMPLTTIAAWKSAN